MKDLVCPLCALSLSENKQGVACINRHQFDRAKEGYFNLLPVQQKKSLEPGDAKQQLTARKTFLTAGFFLPLVEELKKLVSVDVTTVLDVGCGEGYFTRLLSEHCHNADIYGVDIAKAGIRLAAKNNLSNITYVVASSHALPIVDASMDVLTRIYAPSKEEELFRVLKPGGQLIIVTPGQQHLIQLREKIYKTIRPHQQSKMSEKFRESGEFSVCFPLDVPPGSLSASLLDMTPFAWKLSDDLKIACTDEGILDTAHFQVNVYEKIYV